MLSRKLLCPRATGHHLTRKLRTHLGRLSLVSSTPKEPPSSATRTSSNAKSRQSLRYPTPPESTIPHGPESRNLPRRFRMEQRCACYSATGVAATGPGSLGVASLALSASVFRPPQTERSTCVAALGAPRPLPVLATRKYMRPAHNLLMTIVQLSQTSPHSLLPCHPS